MEYPKFTPKTPGPKPLLHRCHGKAATPKGWFLPPSNVVASPKAPRTSSKISFTMPSYLCENSDGMACRGDSLKEGPGTIYLSIYLFICICFRSISTCGYLPINIYLYMTIFLSTSTYHIHKSIDFYVHIAPSVHLSV